MYIQITTRCNMSCAHCGMNCTNKGEDMSVKTYKNALTHCDGEYITIGGGEPTIHPKFWELIGLTLGSSIEDCFIITNGKKTKTALSLARMAERGVLGCELSQDDFHEEINSRVVRAFEKNEKRDYTDRRGIRNTTQYREPINSGRCDWGIDACICDDLFVMPNGDVRACGCIDAPILGNVNTKIHIPEDWEYNTCYKEQKCLDKTE
jgi:MoaA/NifB/PqqE/SkfB family radical SAM enzyme